MRNLWDSGILLKILILTVIGILLGFSPQSHVVELSLIQAGRTKNFDSPAGTANNLVVVAGQVPWRSDLWEQAGHLALQGSEPQLAISCFKQAAASGILSHQGYLQFGDSYLFVGNPFTAVQLWEADIYIFGASVDTLTRLTNSQRAMRDYPGLINSLKGLTKLQMPDPGQLFELGLLLAADDPVSAPPYLLQAAELEPQLTAANDLAFSIQRSLPRDNLTYTLMTAGRKLADLNYWELAAYAFHRAVEAQPDYAEGWAYLGEALQHVGDGSIEQVYPAGAYDALDKAIRFDPQSLPANTFMALYWGRTDNPKRAQSYLSLAEQIEPGNPDIQVDLGAMTAVIGDLDTATVYYQKAIELTDQNPFYLREFVKFCIRYNLNLETAALPIARQALLSEPDNPASLDVMGQVLFRLGDLLNAERFLLRALNQDPTYAPAHLHLGLVYNLQGKSRQAIQAFSAAVHLAPGTQSAALAERFLEDASDP